MRRFLNNTGWARRSARASSRAFGAPRTIAAFTLTLALSTIRAADLTNAVLATATNAPTDSAANASTNTASISIATNAPSAPTNLPPATTSTNALAQSAPVTPETRDVIGFSDFKIIAERNIFNPSRRAPGRPGQFEPSRQPTRIDYLNLVGAMSYEKGRFAFFDGSSSEYRKSVKPGDSIAGYKVASVGQDKVILQNGDKKIDLPVGGQLKREDQGEWRLISNPESFASSNAVASASGTNSPSTSGSSDSKSDSSSDETNPILKRLMEARRQGK